MDRRYERDRGERGNWSREWGNDRNREGRSFRDDDEYGEGQRESGGSREGRYGGEISDYPYRGRSSSYYGALGYGDRNEQQRGGYGYERGGGYGGGHEQRGGYGNDPYQQQSGQQYGQASGQQYGERWGGRGPSREFGDRPFRSSGSEMNPAYFGTGGYYGGFSGGNTGRDEWGGRYGEGRYRDTGIDEDRLGEFRRGEAWRGGGRESGREGGGFFSRLFRRGPKGYTRSDERIREDISERLYADDHVDASEITITVQSGEVTLSGSVETRRMKHRAEDIADAVSGVKDVHNQLKVTRGVMSQIAEKVQHGVEKLTGSSEKSESFRTSAEMGTSQNNRQHS